MSLCNCRFQVFGTSFVVAIRQRIIPSLITLPPLHGYISFNTFTMTPTNTFSVIYVGRDDPLMGDHGCTSVTVLFRFHKESLSVRYLCKYIYFRLEIHLKFVETLSDSQRLFLHFSLVSFQNHPYIFSISNLKNLKKHM